MCCSDLVRLIKKRVIFLKLKGYLDAMDLVKKHQDWELWWRKTFEDAEKIEQKFLRRSGHALGIAELEAFIKQQYGLGEEDWITAATILGGIMKTVNSVFHPESEPGADEFKMFAPTEADANILIAGISEIMQCLRSENLS
jgi:hypothetical protein